MFFFVLTLAIQPLRDAWIARWPQPSPHAQWRQPRPPGPAQAWSAPPWRPERWLLLACAAWAFAPAARPQPYLRLISGYLDSHVWCRAEWRNLKWSADLISTVAQSGVTVKAGDEDIHLSFALWVASAVLFGARALHN